MKAKVPRYKPCELCGVVFEYYSSKARFCSGRCKSLSPTSSGVSPCATCGTVGKQRHTTRSAYVCEKCRSDNPKHGRGHYMRTRCSCEICRDAVNAYQRKWCAKYFKSTGSTYSSSFSPEYWYVPQDIRFGIFERDEWTCQLCFCLVDFGSKVGSTLYPTLDHIVCQSWTETPDHSPSNLRLVCKSCNSSRRDAPTEKEEWLRDPEGWELEHKRTDPA